ncbi:hypothetical protein ACFL35_13280, partial [Candidatus Riflebacteria bacterium]
FFLPALFLVLGILLLFVFQRFFFAKENLNLTVRLAYREILFNVSQSAGSIARARVLSFIEAFNSRASDLTTNKNFKLFYKNLVNSEGFCDLKPVKIKVDSKNFSELIKGTGKDITLEVVVSFEEVAPIFPEQKSSFGEFERFFLLKIISKASRQNFSITTVNFTDGKILLSHLPIYPKFTIFVKEKANFKVNPIWDSENAASIKQHPVIINNGKELKPYEELSFDKMSEFIQKQGFLYFGGAPWVFNLSTIGGKRELADPGIPIRNLLFEIDFGSLSQDEKKNLRFYLEGRGNFRESRTKAGLEFMKLAKKEDVEFSSKLNLFGSVRNPSPTVVLGRVKRNYILEQGVLNLENGNQGPLPFIKQMNHFISGQWPGPTSKGVIKKVKDKVFNGRFEQYKKWMSQNVPPSDAGYNRGIIPFLKPTTSGKKVKFTEKKVDLPILKNLSVNNFGVNPAVMQLDKYITLIDPKYKNRLLYRGNPETFDMNSYLKKKVCFIHKSAKIFLKKRLKKNELELNGAERISGPLSLTKQINLKKGNDGILVADGTINISAGINTGKGHLYIMSTKGDIRINTSSPINAYLLALKGKILFQKNFELNGGMALNEFNNSSFPKSKKKMKINYNQNFDITSTEVRKQGYKIILRHFWDFYVQ